MKREESNISNNDIIYDRNSDASIEMQIAFPDAKEPKFLKLGLCIALYTVLGLIWLPGFSLGNKVFIAGTQKQDPAPRIVLKTPPVKPVEQVATKEKKAKKVPMPDLTPLDPDPIIAATEIPPDPEMLVTDEWEIGIPEGPPQVEQVAMVGDAGVDPPIFTKRVSPNYPSEAVEIRLQGYVVLQAVLKKDGTVDDIEILRGLGRGKFGFEQAAITSLKQWQFLPGKVNGKPEDVRMNLRVDFVLQ